MELYLYFVALRKILPNRIAPNKDGLNSLKKYLNVHPESALPTVILWMEQKCCKDEPVSFIYMQILCYPQPLFAYSMSDCSPPPVVSLDHQDDITVRC